MMDKDKLEELLEARAQAEQELEKMRTPVTILFSDIKGSTGYFEKKGDVAGVAMINRHNSILFPVIQQEGGRIVKTIGDSIMACFADPVAAIKAAAGMQLALEDDRKGHPESEKIHIRIGLHTGLALIKEGDVFGDVVNAASRIQGQAQIEQILVTDVLLDAAKAAGFECARMGRAELRGKDEPIDLYAVAWSQSAATQLIQEVQAQYERRFKELRRQQEQMEEEFENAREQWRAERRNLSSLIEQLEDSIEQAREGERQQVSDELQSELRFKLEEAIQARQLAEQERDRANQKVEAERGNFQNHIASLQASAIEAMERSNNPARMAAAIRDQVEARVADARSEWQLQWESERRRLKAEIERLQKAAGGSALNEKKEAARRALLESLGRLPRSSAGAGPKTADQWEREFQDSKIRWETERDQLNLKIKKLEIEVQRARDTIRSEIYQEMNSQYEPQLAEARRERSQLEHDTQSLGAELATERERFKRRIEQLEQAIPAAQEAGRNQVLAEMQVQFDVKFEEANRLRSRTERKHQDAAEEWEAEQRRTKKRIAALEEELKEAKEAVFRAQKAGARRAEN